MKNMLIGIVFLLNGAPGSRFEALRALSRSIAGVKHLELMIPNVGTAGSHFGNLPGSQRLEPMCSNLGTMSSHCETLQIPNR
jgi:hypothetical protein